MKELIGKNVLATTSDWFIAPDGKNYKAVWGELESINEAKESVGFAINRAHANWFAKISGMVIAGCQLMYLIPCEYQPNTGEVLDWHQSPDYKEFTRPSTIFIAQK